MEATEKKIVGHDTALEGKPLTPGLRMRKQIVDYLRRTKLRHVDLATIAAECGLSKEDRYKAGRELYWAVKDGAVVEVLDGNNKHYRAARAEDVVRDEFPCDEPECGAIFSTKHGLQCHKGHSHKKPEKVLEISVSNEEDEEEDDEDIVGVPDEPAAVEEAFKRFKRLATEASSAGWGVQVILKLSLPSPKGAN